MTLAQLARIHPRWVDAGIRIDRAPAAMWLALQAVALLPTWHWMVQRWRDGSDDPLGPLALAALGVLLWQQRRDMRAAPALGRLALAVALTLLATVLRSGFFGLPALPPLLIGLLSVCALACGALAFLPRRVAALPVLGLAALALPLLSSLQFYAGYPLRVLTAEASRWLLAPLFTTAREGSSLWVDGHRVIVDAPCSGVQMVWLGYFTACAVALFPLPGAAPLSSRSFLARLSAVGAMVLLGNVLRNAVLVGLEGGGHALPAWAHEALGLGVLAAVCGATAWLMARPARRAHATRGEDAMDASSPSVLSHPSSRRFGARHADARP